MLATLLLLFLFSSHSLDDHRYFSKWNGQSYLAWPERVVLVQFFHIRSPKNSDLSTFMGSAVVGCINRHAK
jgi:hypothetical protein